MLTNILSKTFTDANRLGILMLLLVLHELIAAKSAYSAGNTFELAMAVSVAFVAAYEYLVNFRPKLKG